MKQMRMYYGSGIGQRIDSALPLHMHAAPSPCAKSGIETACRPSVCPSVCDVGGSGSHRLETLKTNCTNN